MTASPRADDWIDALRRALERLPSDYNEVAPRAAGLRSAFHETLARTIEPRFNAALRAMPKRTPEERHRVVVWCNRQLRELGLAIRDPETGLPAILGVDSKGDPSDPTRFRLSIRAPTGPKWRTLAHRGGLDPVQLMPAPLRDEPFTRYNVSKRPRHK